MATWNSSYLFPAGEKELIRIHSITDGTAHERDPVKHHWRLILVVEEDLADDIHQDCNNSSHEYVGTEQYWGEHNGGCSDHRCR